jgi:tetratricopeptide (TPR) repeat protein
MPSPDPDLIDRLMFDSVADVEAFVRQLDPDDREKLLAALRDRAAAYERDNASEELELVRFVLEVAEAGSDETALQPVLITTRDELDSAATRCSDPDEAIDLFQQYDELLTEEERGLLREITESRAEAKRLHNAGSTGEAATTLRRAAVLCLQLGLRFPAAALGLTVAETRSRMGHLSSALADARTSAAIADDAGLPELALRARLFAASMLEALDQGDAAAAEYESVATQAAARPSRTIEFQARVGSAISFHNRGLHLEAASVLRNALLSAAAWGTREQIGALHNNLGEELLALGRAEQAAGEFQAALALREHADSRNYGPALSLFGLGDAKMLVGERDEACEYWRQAYLRGFFSGDLGRLLTALAGRVVANGIDMSGRGFAVMGEIPDNTAGMLRIGLYKAIQDGDSARAVTFASWLAHELASAGDLEGGIELCRDILTRYADVDERSTVLQALRLRYASLLLRQGTAGRQQALDVLWDTYTMVDGQMEETLLDERRGEFAGKWIGVIEMLISLLLDHGETLAIPGGADPRLLAFSLHEAAKARGFLAALAGVDVAAPAEVDPGLRHREAELIRLRRELQTEADLTGSGKLFGRIQEVQSQLRDCWQEMRQSAPAFVQLRRAIPSDIEDARRVLLEHATRPMAIVSFFCATDHTRIFVLRSDDPEVGVVRSEVGRESLESVVRQLRRTFSDGDFRDPGPISRTHPERRSLRFFENLGEELLKFMPLVSGVELLCFVPHGPLHGLPLHALPDGDGGYLIERTGTVYAPSISSLTYVLSTTSSPAERAPTVYVAGVAARDDTHPDYLEHDDEMFAGGRWDVLADRGPAVTKHQVLRSSFGRRILHLTCHGYFNERSPLDSGLLLADGGGERPSKPTDRVSPLEQARTILTAREVMSTSMDAEIVVLRACSGSVHAVRNAGDELDGLSRGFLYAGNSAVMASLWNVDRQSSRDLLRAFYLHWSDPVKKPEKWQALQRAQQEFLQSAEKPYLRHPYHWAPFVLHGDWR